MSDVENVVVAQRNELQAEAEDNYQYHQQNVHAEPQAHQQNLDAEDEFPGHQMNRQAEPQNLLAEDEYQGHQQNLPEPVQRAPQAVQQSNEEASDEEDREEKQVDVNEEGSDEEERVEEQQEENKEDEKEKEEKERDENSEEEGKIDNIDNIDPAAAAEVAVGHKKAKVFGENGRCARFYRSMRARISKTKKEGGGTVADTVEDTVEEAEVARNDKETVEEEKGATKKVSRSASFFDSFRGRIGKTNAEKTEGTVEDTVEEAEVARNDSEVVEEEKGATKKVSRSASFFDSFRGRFGKARKATEQAEEAKETVEDTVDEKDTVEAKDTVAEQAVENAQEEKTEDKKERKVTRRGSFYAAVRARLARAKKAAAEESAEKVTVAEEAAEADRVGTENPLEKTPVKTKIAQRVRGVFKKAETTPTDPKNTA